MGVKITNSAFAQLANGITATQVTINLQTGQGARFPVLTAADWAWGTLCNAANVTEVVKITAVSGDVITVVRGQDNTTAQAYAAGDRFELRLPAALFNDKLNVVDFNNTMAALFTGIISMWSGAIAAIPAHWHICDGTNGTPDLRDRFVVGAGASYPVGNEGGLVTNTLTVGQLPAHNHGVTDNGHSHGVTDNGHTHGITDNGHVHTTNVGSVTVSGLAAQSGYGQTNTQNLQSSNARTGISINSAGVGIGIQGSYANIGIQNAGGGQAVENRPPYYALAYIMYTG